MVGGVNDRIMSFFETSTTKSYSKSSRVNNMYGRQKKLRKPKIKTLSEDNIIKAIENRIIRYITLLCPIVGEWDKFKILGKKPTSSCNDYKRMT